MGTAGILATVRHGARHNRNVVMVSDQPGALFAQQSEKGKPFSALLHCNEHLGRVSQVCHCLTSVLRDAAPSDLRVMRHVRKTCVVQKVKNRANNRHSTGDTLVEAVPPAPQP